MAWNICNSNLQCSVSYIGQVMREVKFRINEHNAHVRESCIAKHCWDANHKFDFASAKINCKPSHIDKLDFPESFVIHKNFESVLNVNFAFPPPLHGLLEICVDLNVSLLNCFLITLYMTSFI